MDFLRFSEPITFDWDTGNLKKNLEKHGVTCQEAEDVFFGFNLVSKDELHSGLEARYRMLGRTRNDRYLMVVFTVGNEKLRVISARDANRKERLTFINYEKEAKTDSTI